MIIVKNISFTLKVTISAWLEVQVNILEQRFSTEGLVIPLNALKSCKRCRQVNFDMYLLLLVTVDCKQGYRQIVNISKYFTANQKRLRTTGLG